MKIYITGLPSGYEVEHLVRLFYPMAPLTLTPPEDTEDCVWAEKTPDGLHAPERHSLPLRHKRKGGRPKDVRLAIQNRYAALFRSGVLKFTQRLFDRR